ncbi:MAG TPA: MFS transporter [Streptosporangiaceae bacterium]|jgi:MFS family permease|nr:MFS transporter [Streptosporangiaceae bacterium]
MATRDVAGLQAAHGGEGPRLSSGTLLTAAFAVAVAQLALAIPAVLQGLFQKDLATSTSQLTWISDAFLVPVTLLELTFGVLGDLFGRKRLLIIGAVMLAVGEGVALLTPGATSSTGTRVVVLWIGMIIAGAGAAAIMPTSLAMVAAGTTTGRSRARAVAIWAAALSAGNMLSPVLGGWLAGFKYGSDPNASWRWAPVAIGLLALISAAASTLFAHNSASPQGRSLDWSGQVTVAVALFALMFAVIQGPTAGWGSAEVIIGFIVAAVFLVLFVLAENRSAAPLLNLGLFRIRAFAIGSIATVIGMFCFLGTAYSTSIRLTAILLFTPLHAAIAFVLFNGIALPLIPVTERLLHHYNPRWTMGAGLILMGTGDLWTAAVPVTSQVGLGPVIAPYILIGIGFALAVSAMTAVLVDTVPVHLEGMASAAANMLRDFGFTLGPAVVGAVTLSQAAAKIHTTVTSSPALSKALAAFNASSAKAAVGAVNSGPLGANSVPSPPNPIKTVAFDALGHANSTGYVICGIAGLVAALLVVAALGGRTHDAMISQRSLGTDD